MAKPGLLLFLPAAERMLGNALSDRFEHIRTWEGPDPQAVIDSRGADVTATLTTHFPASLLDQLPNLRLIVVPGAGYDGIDVAAARARGVTVANAGNAHSGDVADHAVALTLSSLHRVIEMHDWVLEDRWSREGLPVRRRHALSAQRFGIVGLGNIGTAVAERLAVFGGEIAWWGPRKRHAPWPRRDSLLDLAAWCTVLLVAARGDVAGLVDAAVIEAVGPDGLIVNISRGAVIDETAMVAALKTGRLGSAALDVFAEEPTSPGKWRDVPNVLLTPHVGGVSEESLMRLRAAAVRNLLSALDGTPVVHEITG